MNYSDLLIHDSKGNIFSTHKHSDEVYKVSVTGQMS